MSDFQVRPFAFMRLTHEALRAGFAALHAAVDAGDVDDVRHQYTGLHKVIALHSRHEEEVFFPMLDAQFDESVRRAGLWDAHEREATHEEAFVRALRAGDVQQIRDALSAWSGSFEQHLVLEEEVMMPLTSQVAPTVEGRALAVRRILEVDWEALTQDHVPYVVARLAETKPYGPTRMFVAALHAASAERYAELAPVVEAALPAATREQLRGHGLL